MEGGWGEGGGDGSCGAGGELGAEGRGAVEAGVGGNVSWVVRDEVVGCRGRHMLCDVKPVEEV